MHEHITSLRGEIETTEKELKKKKPWKYTIWKKKKEPQNTNGWDWHQNEGNKGKQQWMWR